MAREALVSETAKNDLMSPLANTMRRNTDELGDGPPARCVKSVTVARVGVTTRLPRAVGLAAGLAPTLLTLSHTLGRTGVHRRRDSRGRSVCVVRSGRDTTAPHPRGAPNDGDPENRLRPTQRRRVHIPTPRRPDRSLDVRLRENTANSPKESNLVTYPVTYSTSRRPYTIHVA